jgi:hypothetical protein
MPSTLVQNSLAFSKPIQYNTQRYGIIKRQNPILANKSPILSINAVTDCDMQDTYFSSEAIFSLTIENSITTTSY